MDFTDLLINPVERINLEYKCWLDLGDREHQAVLARALIALANHAEGGFVILGFKSGIGGTLSVEDTEGPAQPHLVYSQETVQRIVNKYAEPPFEVRCHFPVRPGSVGCHPVIQVSPTSPDPIVVARTSANEETLRKGTLLVRRHGPESAPPSTAHDWRHLIDTFVARRRGAEQMLSGGSNTPADTSPSTAKPPSRTVRDRMSAEPPPNPRPIGSVPMQLSPEDRFVLDHPVSSASVDRLTEEIRDHLDKRMPMFVLSALANIRVRKHVFESHLLFGSDITSFKGPFVEGSNWAGPRGYEFARPLDAYMAKQFGELIAERYADAELMPLRLSNIAEFVRDAVEQVRLAGGNADLVVAVKASSDDRLEDELVWNNPSAWNRQIVFRGSLIEDVQGIRSQIEGLPVLVTDEHVANQTLIAVVDLSDYSMLLANVSKERDDYLGFSVEALAYDEAYRRVSEKPSLKEQLYRGQHHVDGSYDFGETVQRMQLMADYRLRAAGEFREAHRPRGVARRIG